MLAIKAKDEWLVGRSYISQKSMATLSDPRPEPNPGLSGPMPILRLQVKAARDGLRQGERMAADPEAFDAV